MTREFLQSFDHRQIARLFDFIEDVQFWIKDASGRYQRVNRGFLLNYSLQQESEVVGKTDYDLSPRHLADQFRMDDEAVLEGKSIINRIELVGRFDKTANWSLTTKIRLLSEANAVIGTAGISRALPEAMAMEFPFKEIGRVIGLIQREVHRDISNAELAAEAHLSLSAFERRFRRYFQTSPQQYIKRVRITKACHALIYTDKCFIEIALESGFCDQSYFTKEFRRAVKLTPGQYRQQHQSI